MRLHFIHSTENPRDPSPPGASSVRTSHKRDGLPCCAHARSGTLRTPSGGREGDQEEQTPVPGLLSETLPERSAAPHSTSPSCADPGCGGPVGVPTHRVSSFVCLLHGSLGRSSSKNEFLCVLQLQAGDRAPGRLRVRAGSAHPHAREPVSVFSGSPGGHILRRHPSTTSSSFRNSEGLFPPSKPGGFASDPARGCGPVCLRSGRLAGAVSLGWAGWETPPPPPLCGETLLLALTQAPAPSGCPAGAAGWDTVGTQEARVGGRAGVRTESPAGTRLPPGPAGCPRGGRGTTTSCDAPIPLALRASAGAGPQGSGRLYVEQTRSW